MTTELAATTSERLARIRDDLLDARYALCTQKASLMTDHFQQRGKANPLLSAAERIHYRAYTRALRSQVDRGAPAWKTRLQNALLAAYRRFDDTSEPPQLAFAEAFAHVTENVELRVYPHELIVGNLSSQRIGAPIHPDFGGLLILPELDSLDRRSTNPIALTGEQADDLRRRIFPFWFRRSVLAMAPRYAGDTGFVDAINEGREYVLTQFAGISHLTPDYPGVLTLGFAGMEVEARERLASARQEGRDPTHHVAALVVIRAAIAFARRWRDHLLGETEIEPDPLRRSELRELAAIFERVPEHPARTFHEALQSVFITHVLVHQESFQHGVSFGRMDQYLLPYYQRDVAEGRLDPDRAVELIGCFLGKAAELVPLFFEKATEYFSGLSSASGITLGGLTPTGEDATNELSGLFLHAYDRMRLRQPNIHVRLHADTDEEFVGLCYRVLAKGGGIPAFFNDDEVVDSLRAHGVAQRDALDYAVVGCAEWGVPYRSFPAAGAGFVNLAQVLLDAMHGQQPPPTSANQLLQRFRRRLREVLARVTAANDAIETAHAKHRPSPFLSSIVGGCLERGRDVTAGGADHNSTGIQGVGLADVADSLAAIDQVVFEELRATWAQLLGAIDSDFAGCGELASILVNKVAKYGEGEGRAAHFAGLVSGIYAEELSRFRNPRGGPYLAGFWTMTTHQGFGRRTGALPSGRRSGKPLANGASPSDGRDRRGATASLSDAARLRTPPNGCVTNQKLTCDLATGPSGHLIMDGLVRGFFSLGGAQVQFNVLDPAVLIAARENPHEHRDLVVRISGYSAYFNDLSPEMKDELIARTLHQAA